MDSTSQAIIFATVAHDGQRRMFTDEPYVCHPIRVGADLIHSGDGYQFLAILHDVLEDTDAQIVDGTLVLPGKPQAGTLELDDMEIEVLEALTRGADEDYEDFIQRVVDAGPVAVAIKEADILDNLKSLPRSHRLQTRYSRALKVLEDA